VHVYILIRSVPSIFLVYRYFSKVFWDYLCIYRKLHWNNITFNFACL